jgi:hypothetical protein
MPDRMIELLVSEAGSGPGVSFGWHVRLDGAVVAANLSLTPARPVTLAPVAWLEATFRWLERSNGFVANLSIERVIAAIE